VGTSFSAIVHTYPGTNPASYTLGAGFFSVVKRPVRGFDHPPQPRVKIKERVQLYLYSP